MGHLYHGYVTNNQRVNKNDDCKEKRISMDWCKGTFTGKPHNPWENLWFPVDFPLNQSIETPSTNPLCFGLDLAIPCLILRDLGAIQLIHALKILKPPQHGPKK